MTQAPLEHLYQLLYLYARIRKQCLTVPTELLR